MFKDKYCVPIAIFLIAFRVFFPVCFCRSFFFSFILFFCGLMTIFNVGFGCSFSSVYLFIVVFGFPVPLRFQYSSLYVYKVVLSCLFLSCLEEFL